MPYRPSEIAEALGRVDGRLRQAGFLASRTTIDAVVRQPAARVDLRVAVDAGPRSILRDVIVEGGDAGKPLVARAIALTPGAPIDPQALGLTRRQLYDSGAYRAVEIELQPVADTASPASGDAAAATQLVDARIQLLARPRYRFRYGFAFTDDVVAADVRDRGFGFAADFERRNLFGRDANAGVSARLRRDQQVGRLFVGASRFFGAPLRSTVFLERSRQAINAEGEAPIVATVTDFSAEQSYSIQRRVELRYGYALGRNHTVIEGEDFDVSVRIARLTSSGLVDSAQRSVRSGERLVRVSERRAVEAVARVRSQLPEGVPAVLPLPARGTPDRAGVGGPGGPGADLRGPGPPPDRALLCRRRGQRARLSGGGPRPPQHLR